MSSLRINIILPFPLTKPVGGGKIMYEYANRLQERGHHVIVIHSIRRPFKKMKSPLWWKHFNYKVRRAARPKWFPLHKDVKSVIVSEITNAHIPDGDIVLSTWWEMAYMIEHLNPSKGRPFNLIQDYEVWKGNHEQVHKSYHLSISHLVIAKYLQELVQRHSGICPIHIPNAIETGVFHLKTPIRERDPFSIIMLYSKEPRKGTSFGLQALKELKQSIPQLKVTLFGVYDAPELPDWITYYKRPDNLVMLYNQSAVFFSPSLGEGWALPPAEAMACGCAVVCTAIGGHADYAIDNETALLVQPEQVADMVEKLKLLMQDQQLRLRLAEKGNAYIQENFSWEASVAKLEACFTKQ